MLRTVVDESGGLRPAAGALRVSVVRARPPARAGAHIVYVLQIDSAAAAGEAAPISRRRFSSFVELISALSRELASSNERGGSERGAVATAVIESWRRQLTIEKRHTGRASRSEQVVSSRCRLLNRMLDELVAVPQIATSVSLALFIASD